jgi:hypothetical protein
MRSFLIIALLCLSSCNNTNKNNETVLNTDNEIQDISMYETDYQSISILDIPKEWEMISIKNNVEVIFNPCDKSNYRYKIEKGKRNWILMESTGESIMYYVISNTLKMDDELAIICKNTETNQITIFKVQNFESNAKKCLWSSSRDNFKTEITFVSENAVAEIEFVSQPCSECWDDCK